jgi:hypothetical protein
MYQSVTTTGSLDFYQDIPYSISSVPSSLVDKVAPREPGLEKAGAFGTHVAEVAVAEAPVAEAAVVEMAAPQWRGGMVKVEVADLLDTFRVCLENKFQWIEDFRGDAIWITEDLNQVIEAFENMRRETMHD